MSSKSTLIGSGSYSEVYRVQVSGIWLAKKITPAWEDEEGLDPSVVRECTVLEQLKHPFVYNMLNVNVKCGRVCILFPLATTDLHKWIASHTITERCQLVPSLAFRTLCTLANLHSLRFAHRDIKPANILLDERNQTYLADFGLSRPLFEDEQEEKIQGKAPSNENRSVKLSSLHTEDTTTLSFRPPEISKLNYTTKIDIYSLGCTLITLITGSNLNADGVHPPDPKKWESHLDDWSSIVPLPVEFISLIKSMIRRNPQDRPSAFELLNHSIFSESTIPEWLPPNVYPELPRVTHPMFPLLIQSWLTDAKKSQLIPLVSPVLTHHMNHTLTVFNHKNNKAIRIGELQPSSKQSTLIVLSCFFLVLKLMVAAIPTVDDLIRYTQQHSESDTWSHAITKDEYCQMESHVFVALNYVVY